MYCMKDLSLIHYKYGTCVFVGCYIDKVIVKLTDNRQIAVPYDELTIYDRQSGRVVKYSKNSVVHFDNKQKSQCSVINEGVRNSLNRKSV